jgi:hypothetical protein
VIDAALVDEPRKTLEKYTQRAAAHSRNRLRGEAERFAKRFQQLHGIQLRWTEEGLAALAELCGEKGMSAFSLCEQLLRDFQFGLQLVRKNTGLTEFELGDQAIRNPDAYLSGLVIRSYRGDRTGEDAEP